MSLADETGMAMEELLVFALVPIGLGWISWLRKPHND
jgi:hypothetical protein